MKRLSVIVSSPIFIVARADSSSEASHFTPRCGNREEGSQIVVYRNLASFTPKERGLLLGLIEDAVRNVSWWAPELEGAESIAGIAHWLLDGLQGYGGQEPRKRVLKVIAKIPKADAARFEAALRGHVDEGERRDPVADDLRELIYTGIDGLPAARDLPDLIASVGE